MPLVKVPGDPVLGVQRETQHGPQRNDVSSMALPKVFGNLHLS